MTPNKKAFLDMIADSELGAALISESDNGYNVIVGSRPGHVHTFDDYSTHPHILVDLGNGVKSTAAGRYQILYHIFISYKERLSLEDFSPEAQDAIALQIIKECGAYDDIDEGNLELAVGKCANIWASFPGAGYGQHENAMQKLTAAYIKAGGTLANA